MSEVEGGEESEGPAMTGITMKQQLLASCTGAIITSVFVTPLDVVKVRLQAQQRPSNSRLASNIIGQICNCVCTRCMANTPTYSTLLMPSWATPKFTGTMDAFLKISKYEGLRSLWSGFSPALVMAIPQTVIYYSGYDILKYKMGYQDGDLSTVYIATAAGPLARIVSVTAISPLELVRTKMQSQKYSLLQVGDAVRAALQQEGPLSLMRGLGPTLLRDVPFSAIYWYGYESLKSWQLQRTKSTKLNFTDSFLAGAISGSVAGVLTLPFDVIKTHRQIDLGETTQVKGHQVSSTWKLIKLLYCKNGLTSLYAGLVPRIVKVAPACAIMISSYEFSKSYFLHFNKEQAKKI